MENSMESKTEFINNKNIFYDEVDIDKYMDLVKEELKKIGYSLDKRAFIQNIITILDKLITPNKFNKMIFFHILDFASLPRDSPILLLDFFRSFFTVYESMKINRGKLGQEIMQCTTKMEERNIKKKAQIPKEQVFENGLTNNSKIRIYFNPNDSDVNENLKFKFTLINSDRTSNSFHSEINLSNNFYKSKMKIEDPEQKLLISIFDSNNQTEIQLDEFSIRDVLDHKSIKNYCYRNLNFNFTFIWVNSKIIYYNKEISSLEEQISQSKEAINVLNNSIFHIEETFRKYFQNTGNKFEEIQIGTMKREMEISQNIEDYVLKIVGQEVIIWDRIVFIMNKLMIPFLFVLFFDRADFATVII